MATFAGDVRYAFRAMRGNRAFTAVAVASLALGIGVNTAIFSLVDQLLLWSVPARDPAALVNIDGGRAGAYAFYREYRDRNRVFTGLFATSHPQISGIRPEGAAAVEVGRVVYVSGNYFPTLGVGSATGRVIAAADDLRPGGSPIAVLSYSYWQGRFAGDPRVVGRKLAVSGVPLTIAGVAEKGFTGIFNGQPADAFAPITMYPLTNPAAATAWSSANMHWLTPMARLKPGVSLAQAQASMRVLWPQVADAVNDAAFKRGGRRRKFNEDTITLTPGARGGRSQMADPLQALGVATGLVLLIACANVANLLLARATGRRREIAVRLALGASRGRLVRQLLTESLLLAAIGGALGIALAWWGVGALARLELVNSDLRFHPSLAVAGFSAAATLVTGILFGLAPALRATRIGLADAVKDGGSAGRSARRLRLGKGLIAAQVALSLALLVEAGLFVRTLRNLRNVDVGFVPGNTVIVDIDPTKLGYRGHRLRQFYDTLLERTRHIRGVQSASLSLMTPMGEFEMTSTFSAEGYQPKAGEVLYAFSNPVTERYFTTLGIPMLLGRDFEPRDEPAVTPRDNIMAAIGRQAGGGSIDEPVAPGVCVLNESLARQFFGDASPLGRHLSFKDKYNAVGALEIVGVVKDVRHGEIRKADRIGSIYVPSWSRGAEARWLEVRTAGDAAPAVAAIRRELRDMDPNVPLLRSRMLREYVDGNLSRERLIAWLAGFFGLLAVALASVGLYGVVAYAVTQRTREIGIRMALGAQAGNVVRMIVGDSLVPVLAGVAAGLAGALALARLVAGLLYGVAPRDPLSMALAAGGMLTVGAGCRRDSGPPRQPRGSGAGAALRVAAEHSVLAA
jgi:predicted permease